jgi:hypothetical protein
MPIINPTSGGGFAANATQTDDTQVSIISTAGDGSGFDVNYILQATTDNAGSMNGISSISIENDDVNVFNENSITETTAINQLSFSDVLGAVSGVITQSINQVVSLFRLEFSDTTTIHHQISIDNDGVTTEIGADAGTPLNIWTVPADTGADNATFVAANAPAAIAPTNWIAIRLNGVDGYIPFFS